MADDGEFGAFCSARLVGAMAAPLQAEPPPHPQRAASGCAGR
jgi:hypothetical protein